MQCEVLDPDLDLQVLDERNADPPAETYDRRESYEKCLPPVHTTISKVEDQDRKPAPLPELPELPELSELTLVEPIIFRSNTDPPGLLTAASRFDYDEDGRGLLGATQVSDQPEVLEPEIPTATALEIMQSTKPEEATLEIEEALTALDSYVRGQNSEEHAKQQSSAQMHAAFRVGCWTVLLTLPIIVWPWAQRLQEVSTVQREYLGYWGSMLLQFLFCIGPTLGASTKSTLEGWLGTALATLNMMLLNNAFGPWLSGGAYQNRIEFFDNTTGSLVPTSKWLPLCNNGADLSFNRCFLNMNTALAPDAEYVKALVVLFDFILFVFAMLTFGFNTNVRVFSISTHAFYVMSFLDPSTGSFDISPSLAANYFTIVTGASLAVILCFLIPTPITATSKARSQLQTTGSAVAMILESLPLTPSELCRSKTQGAMDEVTSLMKDLESHLQVMWFEDFGIWKRRATYRRWLQAFFEILRCSMQNIDAVLCAAAALPVKESEQVAATLPSLRGECFLVAGSLRALLAVKTPDEVKPVVDLLLEKRQALREQLAQEFPKSYQAPGDPNFLLPPALVFCLAVTGVVEDSCQALTSLALYGLEEKKSVCDRACRYLQSLQSHVEIKLYERTITHPRFVLRYTLTLTITFVIGWLGVANVIAPYSSQPSSTVSVIIYTFTAASLPLTLKRFNGVLLGKILGNVAERLFAVQTVGHAICFALFQLISVTALVFASFHSKKHGGVALLTAAYAMAALIPNKGLFREEAVKVTSSDGSFLFVTMVGTFLGVFVLLLIDLILASSAKRQAKQRLLRGLGRVSKFAVQVLDPRENLPGNSEKTKKGDVEEGEDGSDDVLGKLQAGIYEDLDELANLLPYAADEPSLYGGSFPVDLCLDLERGLRQVTRHFRIITWAIQLLEKPQKQVQLKAGSRIFKGGRTPKAVAQPLLRNELFRPILATLAEEIQKMLENIRVLTAARLQSSKPWTSKQEQEDSREAEKLRKLLRSRLYTQTVSNAFCKIARSPWKLAWKGAVQKNGQMPCAEEFPIAIDPLDPAIAMPEVFRGVDPMGDPGPVLRRTASNPIFELTSSNSDSRVTTSSSNHFSNRKATAQALLLAASRQGAKKIWSQQRALQKLARKLAKENLEDNPLVLPPVTALEPGGAKQGVADNFALRLLLLFDQLREVASGRRSELPDDDPVSTLELIIFFLGSVQTQIQHMQVSLLES